MTAKEVQGQIIIEEYKWIQQRLDTFEKRYYQILIFCFSSLGVVLGFSDKIENILIPIITTSLVSISVTIATTSRTHQAFSSAFLYYRICEYHNTITYEQTYRSLFYSRKKNYAKRFLRIFSHPLIFLMTINFGIVFYFSFDFIQEYWSLKGYWVLIYLSFLIMAHLLIIRNIIRANKFNSKFWDREVFDHLNKKNAPQQGI